MEPHDIREALSRLPTTAEGAEAAFVKLAAFNHGGMFVERFSGPTPWALPPRTRVARRRSERMIAAIYTHVTPRKERERLAEYLK
jgi:hypothetical protein